MVGNFPGSAASCPQRAETAVCRGGVRTSVVGVVVRVVGRARGECHDRVAVLASVVDAFGPLVWGWRPPRQARSSGSGRRLCTRPTPPGVLESLDARLRQLVRREGVDPQRDTVLVRQLAERLVAEHDEWSMTGAVEPLPAPEQTVGELVARVAGFGPLQPLLDDPAVEEIWINDPSRVFVARHGRHELTNLVLTRRPGGRAGRADAEEQRTPGRPEPALRRRDAPRGAPAARGAAGDQPRASPP